MAVYNDDAAQIFRNSAAADGDAEMEALIQQDLERRRAEASAAKPAAEPAVPAAPAKPSADEDPSMASDVIKGLARGPVAEGADIVDNANSWINETAEYLGYPGLAVMGEPQVRKSFDETFGTPQTLAGGLAQGISGQLAYIMPGLRLFKGASYFQKGMKLVGVSAAVAGATQGKNDGTLSNLATEKSDSPFLDNWLTQALSVDTDDSTAERITKAAIEDMALGAFTEGAMALKRVVSNKRALAQATQGIAEAAGRVGAQTDDAVTEAVEDLANARAQRDLVDAGVKSLEPETAVKEGAQEAASGPAVASADEAAAFGASAGPTPTGSVPAGTADEAVAPATDAIDPALITAAKAKQQAATGMVAEAEARLAAVARTSGADGRVLEAQRQALNDGGEKLGKEANEALGSQSTKNMPPPPPPEPPKVTAFNHLTIDATDVRLFREAVNAGDFENGAEILSRSWDARNYDRITEAGNFRQFIKGMVQFIGESDQSQALRTATNFGQTGNQAEDLIKVLSEESGNSIDNLTAHFMGFAEDIRNMRATVDAMRTIELSIAGKAQAVVKAMPLDPTLVNKAQMVEVAQWVVRSANFTDMVHGVTSELGGSLGILRKVAEPLPGFDEILSAGRDLRNAEADEIIAAAGGAEKILRMAEVIRVSGDAKTAAKNIKSVVESGTIGDFIYSGFVANILSSGVTQGINATGGLLRATTFNQVENIVDATTHALILRDPRAFKAVSAQFYGLMRGAKAGIVTNGAFTDAWKQASQGAPIQAVRTLKRGVGQGTVARAFKTGQRVTGGRTTAYLEQAGRSNTVAQQEIASLLRRGLPAHVPTSGLWSKNGVQVPLLPVPQRARHAMANYVASRTGVAAQMFNFVGRVQGYVSKALVAGDELVAGMNYQQQLGVDAVNEAIASGRTGVDFDNYLQRLLRDPPNVAERMRTVDPKDLNAVEHLKVIDRIHQSATKASKRGTYTETPTPALQAVLNVRQRFPLIRWFAPFVKTPTNILISAGRDFTPVGGLVAMSGAQTKEEVAQAVGRFALTSGIAASIWSAVESGRITGGGPHNYEEREAWLNATGPDGTKNVPYSIKIGDTRYKYNRLDPIAIPMAIMADAAYVMNHIEDDDTWGDIANEMWLTTAEMIKSKSFVEGISNLMHMVEDPERYGARMVVSTVENSVVPLSRFWASIDRGGLPLPDDLVANFSDTGDQGILKRLVTGDNTVPQIRTDAGLFVQLGSTIEADLPPGMSDAFLELHNKIVEHKNQIGRVAQRDFYGEIRVIPDTLGPNIISPFQTSELKELDPLSTELSRIGYNLSTRERFGSIEGIKLTPEQQDRFQLEFAKPKHQPTIKELLTSKILNDDGSLRADYARRGDTVEGVLGGKYDRVAQFVGPRMSSAERKVLKAFPELEAQVKLKRLDKHKAKTQRGVEATKARKATERLSEALN